MRIFFYEGQTYASLVDFLRAQAIDIAKDKGVSSLTFAAYLSVITMALVVAGEESAFEEYMMEIIKEAISNEGGKRELVKEIGDSLEMIEDEEILKAAEQMGIGSIEINGEKIYAQTIHDLTGIIAHRTNGI